VCQAEIVRIKKDVDDFLRTASTIMNRRKSRAGRSLENHVEFLLKKARIPFEMRPRIDGKPDVIIPNRRAYYDPEYPIDRLFVIGIKTTCKDRWRQVLNEGRRGPKKYLLTIQPGISNNQLNEMKQANIVLVVPQNLHKEYSPKRTVQLLTIEQFITLVKIKLDIA
jgi:hypothetical protein